MLECHSSCGRPLTWWPTTEISKPSSRHLLLPRLCSYHLCRHSRSHTNLVPGAHLHSQNPPFRQQTPPAWQPGPSEFQHKGWPTFTQNLSGLNTSELSQIFDQTSTPSGQTSSKLTTSDNLRPSSQASSTSDRPSKSDIMRATQTTLESDRD